MGKTILILCLLLLPYSARAQTIFLDNNPGVRNGCSTYDPVSRSCSGGTYSAYTSPWDASQALISGDTLNIRQGEYWENVTGKPRYYWGTGAINISGAKGNITITNYKGEEVWVKGGASKTDVTAHPNNAISLGGKLGNNKIIGNGYKFHVYGCIMIYGTGNTVQGCDLSGGWDHQSAIGADAWYDVVRFVDSLDAVVRDCKIHDNCNHGTNTAAENKALFMHEHDRNTIVENCSIYSPVATFVFTKYQSKAGTVQATYRFNYFGQGPVDKNAFTGAAEYYGKEVIVHNNIFVNNGRWFHRWGMDKQKFIVYNNTFYNVSTALYSWTNKNLSAHQFFNNIIYSDSKRNYGVDFSEVAGIEGEYIDSNNYYSTGSGEIIWRLRNRTSSSLGRWKRISGVDTNSVDSNPKFLNRTGKFSAPSDFKRYSYPTNGRGNGWPTVMGAYITGNETIGLLQH